MGFILCTGRTRTAGESPGSEGSAAGGSATWGPRKACFVGRGKAKAQLEFSACGKCNIVACALTKRVAAVDKIEEKRKPEDFIGHRNRKPAYYTPLNRPLLIQFVSFRAVFYVCIATVKHFRYNNTKGGEPK